MSPRKLTEDDKQEILQLYRNSEATTSTLANRYEVSSSTISRFLKNKLSSTEYEDLIQQKRLARTPRGEKQSAKKEIKEVKEKSSKTKKARQKSLSKVEGDLTPTPEIVVAVPDIEATESNESKSLPRRRRRRSSANDEVELLETATIETREEVREDLEENKPAKLIIDPQTKEISTITVEDNNGDKISKSNSLILKNEKPNIANSLSFEIEEEEEDDDDDDDDEVNIITLKEMLGEDLEDINDEEDDEDDDDEDDDWEDEEKATLSYSRRDSGLSDVEILPLSQATFPRICYLVIDRSAELIVKPLAEFADLGDIPQDEVRQRTLPVFDNHRIAKRFSHRRERVIKVPDGNMLQKTSRYLQEKGITRLLMDGQIYSTLN
ncbi:hypothetical protein I4641_06180 [Waterburya agarophytonicola K14]|uniref:HTH psq-type domain-containing protein n=1 Tax=Waterburya agarophytonicola KI4 TaxID=2874699 RepID=A0A964BNM1_9CYAN|nr:hypothetical protein [Waterburya agarophytonicola]MCC0176565.1 hypothetical protein [Waterburya agarophytonicola KI4]